jgi:hypothetical protein
LTLALFPRAFPLSLLALTLSGRSVLLLTLGAALALLALLALSLTALPLLGFRLFLTLRRFLALGLFARLPLACGLARGSSTLLGGPRLLTLHPLVWHSLACGQHGSRQECSGRCD